MQIDSSKEIPSIGTVIECKFFEYDEQENPSDPKYWRQRRDVNWQKLKKRQHESIKYQVTVGEKVGGYSKCRGCGREFKDRNESRIQVFGLFTPSSNSCAPPQTAKYNFCLNSKCVRSAIQKSERTKAGTIFYPHFDGKVLIDKNSLYTQLNGTEGIEFVQENK